MRLFFRSLHSQLKCSEAHRSGASWPFPPVCWEVGRRETGAEEVAGVTRLRYLQPGEDASALEPGRRDLERGISDFLGAGDEGEWGLEVLDVMGLLCVWLLGLLGNEAGLRWVLNPALVKAR